MALPRVDTRIWSNVLQDVCITPPYKYIIVVFSRFSDSKVPFHRIDSLWGCDWRFPCLEGWMRFMVFNCQQMKASRCHWLKLLSPSTNAMNKIGTFGKFERYPSLWWTSWTSNIAIGITSFTNALGFGVPIIKSHLVWHGSEQILRLVIRPRQDIRSQQTKMHNNQNWTKTLGRSISTIRAAKYWPS